MPSSPSASPWDPYHASANLGIVNPKEPIEGEYVEPNARDPWHRDPAPEQQPNRWRAVGPGAVGIAVLVAKFKAILFALLSFKWIFLGGKFFLTGFSFFASIWFYALFYGWKFGIVFVLLIAIHEVGHVIFSRSYGSTNVGIYFLPGLGAFTSYNADLSVYQRAVVAFGGPLLGAIGGAICYGFGSLTDDSFWIAAAYVAFLMNLFNLAPLGIFDGGRIAGSISTNLWLVGSAVIVGAATAFKFWTPILILIVLASVPQLFATMRGTVDDRYSGVTPSERLRISIAYFGLIGLLLAGLVASHVAVPQHYDYRHSTYG